MRDIKVAHAELEATKEVLKKKFVGIDATIDSIVEKMSAWYIMPDLMTRPTIINLWGLTGVGKTDLIRSLVKELKFNDKYLEIQMTNKSTDYDKSIADKLLSSQIEPDMSGILLLDEIQRFRTVNENGEERSDGHYHDLWMLLSDGKFASVDTKQQLNQLMLETMFYSERGKNEDGEDDEDDEPTPKSKKALPKKPKTYKKGHWEAQRLKRILKSQEPVEEIMKWDQMACMERISKAISDPLFNTEIDYSKLLIFVSGNLDEAFTEASNVGEVERDADALRERTERVSIITIKKALMARFKPEQIARFGNSHVICPSLSTGTFQHLISRRLSMYEKLVNDMLQGEVFTFTDNVSNMIYENGVFPLQGVRPVYSTIDDFFNTCIPPVVLKAIDEGKNKITIDYNTETSNVEATIGESLLEVKYVGCIDEIRAKNRKDVSAMNCAAVHECGHALLHVLLHGTIPEMMTCNVTSEDTQGYVIPNINENLLNKGTIKDLIATMYGGYVAEQLVFGPDNVSNGSSSDIQKATRIAGSYVYRLGHRNSSYIVGCYESDGNSVYNNANSDAMNSEVERIVNEGKILAMDVLKENMDTFISMVDLLLLKEKLNADDLVEFFLERNMVMSSKETDYEKLFNNFKSSR